MQFETLSKLAESHQMGNKRAIELLTAAGCVAAAEVPFGKGTMRLYDGDAARAALAAAVKAESEAAASAALAAMPPVTAPEAQAAQVGRREILAAVAALQGENRKLHSDGVGDHERIENATSKLSEQNVLLRRALDDMKATVLAKLDALQESFDARIDALADPLARITTPTRPAIPLGLMPGRDPAPRLKVGLVVGHAFPAMKVQIEKEFKDCFDLEYFESDDGRREFAATRDRAATCSVVIGMTPVLTADMRKCIKASGVELRQIGSSISQLRNALTEHYVAVGDKKAA